MSVNLFYLSKWDWQASYSLSTFTHVILFDFVWQHYGEPLDCDLVCILVILQGCCQSVNILSRLPSFHHLHVFLNVHLYLFIYFLFVCLVCWQYFKEIHSIVIQFAFGNPPGGTVNWFYFMSIVSCVIIVSFEHVCIFNVCFVL